MSPEPLLGARRLRELLAAHGVRPTKSLGQNFVIDPNTIRKVVAAASVTPDDVILEIGAGAGSLTLALADRAAGVVAMEVDPRLIGVLRDALGEITNVSIVEADAMRADLRSAGATKVVANLPYNIAASVVIRTLMEAPEISELTVMTQREVGERLAANPGSRVYGQTSVLVALFATAKVVAPISRRAFYPVPKVDSVLVKIRRQKKEALVSDERVVDVVHVAFAQRRKMLRSSLAGGFGADESARALAAADIDPSARPETLNASDFVRLAKELPLYDSSQAAGR